MKNKWQSHRTNHKEKSEKNLGIWGGEGDNNFAVGKHNRSTKNHFDIMHKAQYILKS